MHMLALITSCGTEAYSAEAVKEAGQIQGVQAKHAQTIYFTLWQPEEEADRVKTKAVLRDTISMLNLCTVFPRLKHADQMMHKMVQDLLLEEVAERLTAHVYGKNDVLLTNCWVPRDMDASAMALYYQTVEMTEPQLQDLRT